MGIHLHVHNRTREKAEALLKQGAVWHDTPESAAAAGDAVITMLGLPADVDQVYFGQAGEGGILAAAKPGSLTHRYDNVEPEFGRTTFHRQQKSGAWNLWMRRFRVVM